MRIRNAIFHVIVLGVWLLTGVMGVFAGMGLCAAIWGEKVLNTALGSSPDRSHPAFWVFLLVALPSIVIGLVGGLFAFVLPLYSRFNVSLFNTGPNDRAMINFYRRVLREVAARNWPDSEPDSEMSRMGQPADPGNHEGRGS